MDYENMSKEELINALKNTQEINQKLLDLMQIQNNKFTEISIQALEEQIKARHRFLAQLEENEPSKIFKNAHRDWENKMFYTKKDIEDLDKRLYEDYTELGESLQKLAQKKEDNN